MQGLATYGYRASRLRSPIPLASWLLAIIYLQGPILDHCWSPEGSCELPFPICVSECLPTPISIEIGIRLVDGGAQEYPPETVYQSLESLIALAVPHTNGFWIPQNVPGTETSGVTTNNE